MRSICFFVAAFGASALQTGSECSVPLSSHVNSCDADGCCGLGVTSIAHGSYCQAQCVDGLESGNLVQCFNGVLDFDFGCATPSLERMLQPSAGPSDDSNGTDSSNGTESDDVAVVTRPVTGSITFTVDDPAAFANSTEVQTSLQTSMAEHVGVMASQVTVDISVVMRRLSQLRRLAGGVVVTYEITGANPDAVTALETAAADPTALVQKMNADFTTANIEHTMTDVEMTAVRGVVDVADQPAPRGELPSSSGSSELLLSIPVLVLALVFASA